MMNKPLLAAALAAAALAASGSRARRPPRLRAMRRPGQKKTQMCAGCHGIVGWRTAYPEVYKVPKIGGQHAAYIVKALQEYKSGER